MKLAIMQPYLFPYIGYFQLIKASDAFVIHDDVQYIKGGWINRNRILVDGKDRLFTLGVKSDASHLPINRREFTASVASDKAKILRLVNNSYRKAPFFAPVYNLIEKIFACEDINVAAFTAYSLKRMCAYLGIQRPMVLSSQIDKNNDLKAQDRVINIVRCMKADHYINPIGGVELYNKATFTSRGLTLNFLKPIFDEYPQFGQPFVAELSIIDVCMFNAVEHINVFLDHYDLI
jgi:hypothetical protein